MKNGMFLCAALVVGTLACAHEPKKTENPTGTAPSTVQPQAVATSQSNGPRACSSDTDCGDKQLCIRSQCVDITPDMAECSTVRVHFDFNEANLHEDETAKLVRMGRCLKADHTLHVTIEGNADERGTEEWNLALGDKRASAVEDYLERLGVSAAQLRRVTYGKDRPLCTQHNEECWAKNRRAALKTKESR
jgi:peptidoglycan-associated lipoprotein